MGISINRAAGRVPSATRATVPVNSVFRYADKTTGKPTGPSFANLGHGDKLGKYFSVAVDGDKRGQLSSSRNGSRTVCILGTFKVEAKMFPTAKLVTTNRSRLNPGDVFQVPKSSHAKRTGRPSLYVHLGTVKDDTAVLSWNLNTRTLAIGTKLNGAVRMVGDINLDTKLAA